MLGWAIVTAWAADPAPLAVVSPASATVTVSVAPGGLLRIGERPIAAADLPAALEKARWRGVTAVVVQADPGVAFGDVVAVTSAAARAGLGVSFAAQPIAREPDPMFPREGEAIEELGTGLTPQQEGRLAPRRARFPQNPYGAVAYTAYTLEWGEARVGLASLNAGILPGLQVGTSPVLDAVGAYNGSIKANLMRAGPLDGAVHAQLYAVPVNDVIRTLDGGRWGLTDVLETESGEELFTLKFGYLGLGWTSSLQIAGGWSVHGGADYSRVRAEGAFDLQDLPPILAPGLDPEGDGVTIVTGIAGELVQLRLATDFRFNRRDAIVVQAAAPVWARFRGGVPEVEGQERAFDLLWGFHQVLDPQATYRASVAYQASWKRWDLRVGVGASAVPWLWVDQAIDLSYRFGGETRRTESRIERGFRRNRRELDRGGDAPTGAPAPAGATGS